MARHPFITATAALALASLTTLAPETRGQGADDNWPRFRGPNGQGVSNATSVPVKWTDAEQTWKVKLPGLGHSSPAIWGQKIFVSCGDEATGQRLLVCLNADTGKTLWTTKFDAAQHAKHKFNSYASTTPAVDAKQAYFVWATPDQVSLAAVTHEGKEVWRKDLGKYVSQHGYGASPIVHEDLVIVTNDQDGDSFVAAYKTADGAEAWRVKHKALAKGATYSTPCVYAPAGGKSQLIFANQGHGLSGVDPRTGAVLWETPNLFGQRVVASPLLAGDLVMCSCGEGGSGKTLAALKLDPKGGQPVEAFKLTQKVPYVPTVVAWKDHLFLFHDGGTASCASLPDGKPLWTERLDKLTFFGSPVVVNGVVYAIAQSGQVVTIPATGKFEVLGRSELGDQSYATPAVAGGRMYLRTFQHLICVGGKSGRS